MRFVIPRGIIYHTVSDDLSYLFKSLFLRIDDPEPIRALEDRFAEYVGREYCVAFPFARTAVYHVLKYLDLPRGSEIIMPPVTIKAMLDVVLDLGLKPVFVDIDPETLCFDLQKVKEATSENTRAILITYLFGMVPAIDALIEHCQEHGIYTIEDFSQCLNGRYNGRRLGAFGKVGIYSSSSTKTLDTYGGGMLVCDDEELHRRMRAAQQSLAPPSRRLLCRRVMTNLARNVATRRWVFHFLTFPAIRFINRVRPGSTIKHTGGRSRAMIDSLPEVWFTGYTSLQAEYGLRALRRVAAWDEERIANCEKIKEGASRVRFPKGTTNGENVYWQLIADFDNPERTQDYLLSQKVDTSTTSLEKISTLPAYPYQGVTPNAERLYTNGTFIPCFPRLSRADVDYIVAVLNRMSAEC